MPPAGDASSTDSHPDSAAPSDLEAFDRIGPVLASLRRELGKVMIGQNAVIDSLLAAVLCRGHVLVIGVPGLAKTLLVRTLARAVGLSFSRIQFTPDMMPSDIIGAELIQEDPQTGRRTMQFVRGPIFAQLILADELNRAPPKTQSALLEAMAEQQVTTAGQSLVLDQPFIVVATQNPIEQEGTYPLPEAQLDRFTFSLRMAYPSKDEEMRVVGQSPRIRAAGESIEQVVDAAELSRFSELIWRMPVTQHVVDYAVSLARATRPDDVEALRVSREYVSWGAGPRAGQAMIHAARAYAAIDGRPTPSSDDIRRAAPAVLAHRLVLNYAAVGEGLTVDHLVAQVIGQVSEPNYS